MDGLSQEMIEVLEKMQDALGELDCADKLVALSVATGSLLHHLLEDHLPDGCTPEEGVRRILGDFLHNVKAARQHCVQHSTASKLGENAEGMGGPPPFVSPPAKGFH